MTTLKHPGDRDQDARTAGKEHREYAPAPLGASYDKARRSYGVATALLLAWALIGIELKEEPLSSVHVTLKSPQAAPYVFIAAMLYFAFRFTVEWYQADAARREVRAAQVDYWVAHALGGGALLLFVGQKLFHVQLADKVSPQWADFLVLVVLAALAAGLDFGIIRNDPPSYLRLYARFLRVLWISLLLGVANELFFEFELRSSGLLKMGVMSVMMPAVFTGAYLLARTGVRLERLGRRRHLDRAPERPER